MASDTDPKSRIPLIGLLAVKNHLITREDLQKALSAGLGAEQPELAVKEYLLSNNLVSDHNMERLVKAARALDLRQKEFKFGAVAIRKGFINQSVLKLALEEQENDIRNRRKVRLIGDMLVEAGMLTEKQRDYILKLQKRVREEAGKDKSEKPATNSAGPGSSSPDPSSAPSAPGGTDGEQEEKTFLDPETIIGGIRLEVTRDFMAAFLSKTEHFDSDVTPVQIKGDLYEKGIVAGLAEDGMIEGFIRSGGFKTKSFRVARGIPAIQGKDARIEFFFDTDYLKAGGLTLDGSIDFKDRGDLPFVEAGTVLAEKIPMVEARKGQNIYGDEIEAVPGKDIALKLGKGTKLSEDGIKIIAAVGGFPKYALSGHVFVHEEYVSEGDVDYETGHIHFDGNVNVKGRVKSGFRVTANHIQAVEVDGGILSAEGNVKVSGGITEARIYARGNIYAKFIHKSEIVCMGDVVVEKEIVDADVDCSGSCIIENGKLISSRITAKMGVKVRQVGTEMSAPSTIRVGHDTFTEKELEKLREKMDALTQQIQRRQENRQALKEENLAIQKQITEVAHVQDRSQLEEKDLLSRRASMDPSGADGDAVRALDQRVEKLRLLSRKAEEKLDECFQKSEQIESRIEKEVRETEDLEKRLADCRDERNNLIQWSNDNPGKPFVIVEGLIMPETLIRGKYTEKRMTETVRHARIVEVLCSSEDGRSLNIYEMRVGNI